MEFDLGTGNYSRDIARARTFGFTKDVEMMRSSGLAWAAGMDNAIVMDDYKVLNADGLRYDDEFVKHKILDAMGDLYLVGKAPAVAYSAFRSGHAQQPAVAGAGGPRGLGGRHFLTTSASRPPASRNLRAPGDMKQPCGAARLPLLSPRCAMGRGSACSARRGDMRGGRWSGVRQ